LRVAQRSFYSDGCRRQGSSSFLKKEVLAYLIPQCSKARLRLAARAGAGKIRSMPITATLAAPIPEARGYRLTALIIAAAMFMEQLDGTVLATALPAMARSFHVGPLHMNVALTSYLLSLAVFIPASGQVADRFGSRTVFRGAIVVFTLGSVLCAQSGSLTMLVASRVLQGIGGAMMMPVGRLVLLRSVARNDLVRAMGWVFVPGLIGPVVGPPLGGFFVTYLSWHWIFYINVPIGLLGIVMVSLFIEDVRQPAARRFDWAGFVLSGLALSCLMFGFELLSRGAVSALQSAVILVTGLVAGALYLRHAQRVDNPVLDVRLMRVPSFSIAVWGGSFTRITGGAVPFLLPMMMQLGFGFSAAQSGLITFASAAGAMLMKAAAAPILRRYGFRPVMIWNGVLATVLLMSTALFRPGWPLWLMYVLIFAGGFFQSLQFTAYNSVAYAEIPAARNSAATSFYTTFQQLMLSAGICVAACVLAVSLHVQHHAHPQLSDFSVAWVVVGLISLAASPICAGFSAGVGDEMTGRE
jgi:EmrB/QacA subfamily drug resistance transporter